MLQCHFQASSDYRMRINIYMGPSYKNMKRENKEKSFKTKENKRHIRVGGRLAEGVVGLAGTNVNTMQCLQVGYYKIF